LTTSEVFVPTYSYACTECENRFDEVQSFSDDALTTCPKCSGRLRKLFGNVGVVFKGSGFYRTDNRESAKSTANGSASSSEAASSSSEKSSEKSTDKSPEKSSSGSSSDSGSSSTSSASAAAASS
jgi:putative FmdB family regulatory protein